MSALQYYREALLLLDDARTKLSNRTNRLEFIQQRLARYSDLINIAVSEARLPALAFEFVERARGRVFVEDLALSSLRRPSSLPREWFEKEFVLLNDLEDLRESPLTLESLELIKTVQNQLEEHWLSALEKEQEYVSLRRNEPLSFRDVQQLLDCSDGV